MTVLWIQIDKIYLFQGEKGDEGEEGPPGLRGREGPKVCFCLNEARIKAT